MNRETKVGLITGLAIIVMVGMLLSSYLNHQSSAIKLAKLSNLGSKLRQSLLHPVSDQTIPIPSVAPKGTALASATTAATQQQPSAAAAPAEYAPTASKSAAVVSMPGYSSPQLMAVTSSGAGRTHSHAAGLTYRIKPGDTLYGIAALTMGAATRHNIDAIKKANGITNDRDLRVGEKLRIP